MIKWVIFYILSATVTLVACRHMRREIKRLQVENLMLRVQYKLLGKAFISVAQDWMLLLRSQEQFGVHCRPVVSSREVWEA